MMRAKVMEEINQIFSEVFEDLDITITDTTTAEDIEGWDSLTHLELISAVESTFHIHFNIGEVNSFPNVGSMCDSIIKHLG